jgi:hypothetical protein
MERATGGRPWSSRWSRSADLCDGPAPAAARTGGARANSRRSRPSSPGISTSRITASGRPLEIAQIPSRPSGRGRHLEAVEAEHVRERLAHGRVVVDDQQMHAAMFTRKRERKLKASAPASKPQAGTYACRYETTGRPQGHPRTGATDLAASMRRPGAESARAWLRGRSPPLWREAWTRVLGCGPLIKRACAVGEQGVVLCGGCEEVEDEGQAGRSVLLAPAKPACVLQFEVRLEGLLDRLVVLARCTLGDGG